ncbi:MAG: M15 family metallopeptidase, partial [Cyanobacteria bacterium P01_D01_bin.128]
FFAFGRRDRPLPKADEGTLLGHRPFAEASAQSLVTVGGRHQLRPAAAQKLQAMLAQAQRDGVNLQIVSGFRTEAEQARLFFGLSAQRGETPSQRAEVSAPPGYSEHHTGYAVDFIDGYYPDTHLETGFENTPAFRWLQANAARYGFELSFPKDNSSGVSYEPWHWRFVGDRDSLETFYQSPSP